MIVLYAALILIALFLCVILIRAFSFTPKAQTAVQSIAVEFDAQRAIDSLQQMVRLKTVSGYDFESVDQAPFNAFRVLLQERYPLLHQACELERIGNGGLLYHWRGKSADAPTIYMAHYDVVPADEEKWAKPPFSGIRENGELWGRGTLDTKGTLCAALESAETLLQKGFVPQNDIYFSFASDEEVAGSDAPTIVQTLYGRGVRAALVLDEGGAVVENVFPGVSARCALIGTGEKGMLNVEFKVEGSGGHASAPPPHSPVGVLSRAVCKVENKPFQAHLCLPVKEMFDTLGRHSTFLYRLIFANLWCFFGVLNAICKKAGGELNAFLRTTCAFTCMQGSAAYNVLPPTASVTANLRIMSPETTDSVLAYLKNVIENESIKLTSFDAGNPSAVSSSKSAGFDRVRRAIEGTWQGALVSPYLMVACSDSRHFSKISDTVLRFSAMALTAEDRKLIHGNDERIREEQFYEQVSFYMRMISLS